MTTNRLFPSTLKLLGGPPLGPTSQGGAGGRTRWWALLGVTLSLAACAPVTPRPTVQPATPAAWSETVTQPVAGTATASTDPQRLAEWWRQLQDPSLDLLIEKTLAGNLDLQTALSRVAEARARRLLAQAALYPNLDASATAAGTERAGDGQGLGENYGLGVDMAWEVDLFGGQRLAVTASSADLAAAQFDHADVQVALVAETVATYCELRTTEARLAVVRSNLVSRTTTWELTQWREQAGLASALELAQAQASLEQTRASIPSLEQAAQASRLRLALLAGLAGTRELEGWLAMGNTPQPPATLTLGIPADTLRQRPDLRAAESRLQAALARLGEAEKARYPSLRLTGSLELGADRLANLLDADSWVGNLLAGLTAPLFDAGRIRQNISVQEETVRRAELAWRQALLQALSEVEGALSSHRRTLERLAALDLATRAASEAADLAELRYRSGLIDLLTVLETQRTLLNLEDQRVAARGDLLASVTSLYRALGGGWNPSAATGDSHG